jgi:hypothetical protein
MEDTETNADQNPTPPMRRNASPAPVGLILWYIALCIIAVVALLMGLGVFSEIMDPTLSATGALGLFIVLGAAPVAVLLSKLLSKGTGAASVRCQEDLIDAISRLIDQTALSDDARGVLNRRRERELLCQAIEEDIIAQDWDAAMVLVKELAERFGYRADAEEFRQRIERVQSEVIESRVNAAIAHLDSLIVQRRWESAFDESARIARLYPDSPRIEGLRHRIERARLSYKAELERRFLTAAQDDRIDEAMELLKELDRYLTEADAEHYREVARGVIGKARENLGAQFKLAVQDRQWVIASSVGERIIAEFPNTRMAQEVREVIDGVRQRAAAMS